MYDPRAKFVFDRCWEELVAHYGGVRMIQAPREIVLLNGAPGSGKGATTPYVLKARGLARGINVSSLLHEDPDASIAMAKGQLVDDGFVLSLLLKALFDPSNFGGGCLVDGFPRTPLQVDCTKLLFDRLHELHSEKLEDTGQSMRWNRPAFKCVVLFVDEEESVKRQLSRGRRSIELARRAERAGLDGVQRARLFRENGEVRETDMSEDKAKQRYDVFREHYGTLLRLKEYFPFHIIDAMGSIAGVEQQIENELRYQSSLELSQRTYEHIKHIPLAKDLTHRTRERLVSRLDRYCQIHLDKFEKVLGLIDDEVIPLLRRNSLSGYALYQTTSELFCDGMGVDMMIDVLSDRGFSVSYRNELRPVWVEEDLKSSDHGTIPPLGSDLRSGGDGEEEEEEPTTVHDFTTSAAFRMRFVHRFRVTFDSARKMLRGNSPVGFGGNEVRNRMSAVAKIDDSLARLDEMRRTGGGPTLNGSAPKRRTDYKNKAATAMDDEDVFLSSAAVTMKMSRSKTGAELLTSLDEKI